MWIKVVDCGLLYKPNAMLSGFLSCVELQHTCFVTENGGGTTVGSGEGLQQAVM